MSPQRSALTRCTGETSTPIPTPAGTPTEPSRHGIYSALPEPHSPSHLYLHLNLWQNDMPIPGPQSQPVSQESFKIWKCAVKFLCRKPRWNKAPITNSYQLPVPSGPVTAKVSVAGHSGCRPFCPVTEASRTRHSSLLNTSSTGPRTLTHNTGSWKT